MKLMKTSTFAFDTSLLGLIPFCLSRSINYYCTCVRPPLTRYDIGITCWRWARRGVEMASIYNPAACIKVLNASDFFFSILMKRHLQQDKSAPKNPTTLIIEKITLK